MRKKAPVTTQCSNPQIRKAIYNNNKSSSSSNNNKDDDNKRSRTQRDPNSTGKKNAIRNRRRSAMQIGFQNCPSPLSDRKHSEEEGATKKKKKKFASAVIEQATKERM
jgi:Zn-dependent oligopeptidase